MGTTDHDIGVGYEVAGCSWFVTGKFFAHFASGDPPFYTQNPSKIKQKQPKSIFYTQNPSKIKQKQLKSMKNHQNPAKTAQILQKPTHARGRPL
jgi:hypothetical protein